MIGMMYAGYRISISHHGVLRVAGLRRPGKPRQQKGNRKRREQLEHPILHFLTLNKEYIKRQDDRKGGRNRLGAGGSGDYSNGMVL